MLCKYRQHFFHIKHFQLNTENNAIRYLVIDVQSFAKLQKKKTDFKFKKCMNGVFLPRYLFEFRSDIGK